MMMVIMFVIMIFAMFVMVMKPLLVLNSVLYVTYQSGYIGTFSGGDFHNPGVPVKLSYLLIENIHIKV